MEADGSSPAVCDYCNLSGHRKEQCKDLRRDIRFDGSLGCLMLILLLPCHVIGCIAGAMASAAVTGYHVGLKGWRFSVDAFRAWVKRS